VIQCATHHRRLLARRHHHHRKLRVVRAQMHQRAEPVRAGHGQIQQQQVRVAFAFDQRVQRIDAFGFADRRRRQRTCDRVAQGFAEQRVVVGDEDGVHGGGFIRP
jgi:hypothetical protein